MVNNKMSEEEVIEKPTLSDEAVDSIFKGVRPEGMEYNVFKYYQRLANNYTKQKLKGTFKHVSSWIEPIEGTKDFIRKTSTYVKPVENA